MTKLIKWGLITLVALYLSLCLINIMDEAPSEDYKSFLAIPAVKSEPANGYLALVGMNAPPDKDPYHYGTEWVNAYSAANNDSTLSKANDLFLEPRLGFKGKEKLLCNPSKARCLPKAKELVDTWHQFEVDNALMVARQRHLLTYTRVEESYFPPIYASPFPVYRQPFRLLMLDLIALDAVNGKVASALDTLEATIVFDRKLLAGSHSLLAGLWATAWLEQDYALLAEIIAAHPDMVVAQKSRLLKMTEPLQVNDVRSYTKQMFVGEFSFQSRAMTQNTQEMLKSTRIPDLVARPFFKPQALLNLSAHYDMALVNKIGSFEPAHHEDWLSSFGKDQQRAVDKSVNSWRVLYNPIGKYIFAGSSLWENSGTYITRLFNLVGVTRLARLQVEAISVKDKANVADYLSANPALYDPYSGKPMVWEVANSAIKFTLRGELPEGILKDIRAGI